MRRLILIALSLWLTACGTVEVPVVVHTAGLDPSLLSVTGARIERTLDGARLFASAGKELVVTHPEACPATVTVTASGEVTLRPLITIAPPLGPIGFDAPFTLEAKAGCPEAEAGELTWRQAEGRPLAASPARERNERSFRSRTHSLAELRPGPLPWGIVPLSPATQGAYTIEATWRGPGRGPVVSRVRVLAAARATGVPSLTVSTPVLLGGEGWRIERGPKGATLTPQSSGGVSMFNAERSGRWELIDGKGRTLGVRANRHDETPLDCGRAECHPRAALAAVDTPMTRVLHDGLEGRLGDTYDARCALACHAVGEPGTNDGGFADVARRIGVTIPARAHWADLPRELRRLGGVGCTACHGPAAIPEDGARWSILSADVCAVCHDAPPRYAIVAAWRGSRMARADTAPGTTDERCRTCHTTRGFLHGVGVRPLGAPPPEGVGAQGIACAACHAPHGAHGPKALLREVPVPALLGGSPAAQPEAVAKAVAASGVCLGCHAPIDDQGAEGAAAALWLGRGGVRADGSGLEGPAPHATVPCTGCHDAAGHTFKARPEVCAPCHTTPPRVDATIAARAAALLPAGRHPAPRPPRGDPAWNAALVVEDPAAAIHNAPYARALLDEAERPRR